MPELRFEWDDTKNRRNIKRHGISFEEAQEDRFLVRGISFQLRGLVVCHCYRERDGVIWIISARKATRQEATHDRR